MTKKTTTQMTLAVLAHRARALPEYDRPISMKSVLQNVGASAQWWAKLSAGLVQNPDEGLVKRLVAELGVSRRAFDRALAETRRRAE